MTELIQQINVLHRERTRKETRFYKLAGKKQPPNRIVNTSISSFRYRALCNFIEQLHNEDLLSTDKLSARLDPSLLSSLNGVIMKENKHPANTSTNSKDPVIKRDNNDFFLKRLRKILTDTYYRQKRYNLLREESEGYAKLLNFLNGGLLMEGKRQEDETSSTASDTKTDTKEEIPIHQNKQCTC